MVTRRLFLEHAGLTGGLLGLAGAGSTASAFDASAAAPDAQPAGRQSARARTVEERLTAAVAMLPLDDTHCHPISDKDAQTTPSAFLERIALAAFPASAYFPQGVFQKWTRGDEATRAALDKQYAIRATVDKIVGHFSSSVFVKAMVKEMAGFLGCKPTLEEVIEARNTRGKQYYPYINALFKDVRLENVMIDTGFTDGLNAEGMHRFEDAIKPSTARYLARVETIQGPILREDISFAEVRDRFTARVKDALDGTGNYGRKSWGMKSYLLPRIGLITPCYDEAAAAKSWDEYKAGRTAANQNAANANVAARPAIDREAAARRGKVLLEYLVTLAIEECLARDMPMQFHAGDGEAPGVILRNQQPYFLEEIVRFDKDGVMRMPKIIPIHAGYPLVGEAAWLSHLYTNCYFELSLMTPFIHQGLLHRYLEIMEAVPLSKILYGSDAYNVPELYWLAGRWGKRFLAQALAVYVTQGLLTEEEALEGARQILYKNNRATYNLPVRS